MAHAIKPRSDLGPRRPRIQDRSHLAFIRQLPCVACFIEGRTEAAHIRFGDPEWDKRETGMAEKPDDKWSAPLCNLCHRDGQDAQHKSGERDWWAARSIDPLKLATELYAVSGDIEAGRQIIFMRYA